MSYLSERQRGLLTHRRLLLHLKNSLPIVYRLKFNRSLDVHHGCVNTIAWNDRGSAILSGSDDQHLIVTDPFTSEVLVDVHSGHRENIFSAKFLPETNDQQVVSCSGDGIIFHTNFTRTASNHGNHGCFTCHGASTAYEVRVFPHTPNLFLSCSDDCTVRLYDLRTKSHCLKDDCHDDVLIRSKWGITSMDINPMNSNEIVCACSDSSVRLYDHRKLSTLSAAGTTTSRPSEGSLNGLIARFVLCDRKERRPPRITSVVFNRHGSEILTSYSSESLFLLNPKETVSQEQSQKLLEEHRKQKKARSDLDELKSSATNSSEASAEQTKKASQFKRLRLRGDWSDTGPDSRPSNEDTTETNTTQADPVSTNETRPTTEPNRNSQNFFMQRMSDILTQLVNRSVNDTGSTAATTGSDSDAQPSSATSVINEVNSGEASESTSAPAPIVQLPPTPPPGQQATNPDSDSAEAAATGTTGNQRSGFFDMIFGENRQRSRNDDDDDDDDGNDDEDIDDDDSSVDNEGHDNDSSAASTSRNARSAARARHPLMTEKWDRIMRKREFERRLEENMLQNVPSLGLINSYDGHRNARTMIKEANFWSDSYVMSGSDCGHIFIWNKFTGQIVRIIDADKHVVNCIQPHPLDYPLLASSGIDYNIKLFSPLSETPIDDGVRIRNAVKRNYAMLAETSSTITVPAAFMFRMLTSLYRSRRNEDAVGLFDDNDED